MRHLTQKDIERGKKLEDLGCIVCLEDLNIETPAGIHHIDGQTKPGCHQKTLPLCSKHHQIPSNFGYWISRHGDGKAAFEAAYGSEEELLDKVNEMIGEYNG